MRRCDACKLLHDANCGWAFCQEVLDSNGLLIEARDRDFVNELTRAPSREDRELKFFLWCMCHESFLYRDCEHWVVQGRKEPLGGYLAVAAEYCLPTVVSRMLEARANPNAIMPPRNNFDETTPLHEAVVECQDAPVEARVACVKELLKHRADPQQKNIYGATPLDLLVRSDIAGQAVITERWREENDVSLDKHVQIKAEWATKSRCNREVASAMGPSVRLAFGSELQRLQRRKAYVHSECPCLDDEGFSDMLAVRFPDEEDAWPHVLVRGPCEVCAPKARTPVFCCNICRIWKAAAAGHPGIASVAEQSLPKTCAKCRLGQATCTNCGQSIEIQSGRRLDLQYQYCSKACEFPPCAGPGGNGKGCKMPRLTDRRKGRPLRFDEERNWRCTACRKRK